MQGELAAAKKAKTEKLKILNDSKKAFERLRSKYGAASSSTGDA